MAVSLPGRAVPLTIAITMWLSIATALPAATQPEGPSTADRGLYQVVVAAPDRNARGELARHGFAIDAVGDGTLAAVVDASGLAQLKSAGSRLLTVMPLDFLPADGTYHNYAKMTAAIHQAAADRPDIVRVSTIGESVEGRATRESPRI